MKHKIITSEEAASETLGYAILLGIVVLAVGIMVVLSFPVILNIKDTLLVETATEAFTLLDAKASMVAFGTSPYQITRLDLNGGTITANNNTSNLLIIIKNNTNGNEIFNYSTSLGTVNYITGNQKLTFEGGGLFRSYQSAEPTMVSPPEFHFIERSGEGGTLTFPIIRIVSTGSMGGNGAANIYLSNNNSPIMKYPNLSSSENSNPVFNKQINISIKSDNYKAWGKYIIEKTDAKNVLLIDATHEVMVSLNSSKNFLHIVERNIKVGFD